MNAKVSKASHTGRFTPAIRRRYRQLCPPAGRFRQCDGSLGRLRAVGLGALGAVETIEYNRDKGIGVSVYLGQRRGNASTSDFSIQAVRDTVDAALNIARYTAEDDCAGLPDADQLATEFPDLDLYHPWKLTVEQAIQLAGECEQAAFIPISESTIRRGRRSTSTKDVSSGQQPGICRRLCQFAP